MAASTQNGRLLWQYPYGNYQLVLRAEGLYAGQSTEAGRAHHFAATIGLLIAVPRSVFD